MPRSVARAASYDGSAWPPPRSTEPGSGREGTALPAPDDQPHPPPQIREAVHARIVIVEDDAILALRIRKTVEAMGYQVAGLAATGEDAIRLAEEARPDVVLMDVCLRGEMTGVEAAASIRARGDTPVIYVTAYSDDNLIDLAARTAPYAYLTKPIRDRELRASIEAALYRSRTDRALARLNRVLRSVRDVNQLITREVDAERLLDQACRILLRSSGYRCVWIVQPDVGAGELVATAHAGTSVELLDWTARQRATDGEALYASVLRSGRSLVTREPAAPAIGGCLGIVPLRHAEHAYGCLCVHATSTEQLDQDEIGLLEELAGDLAFALRGIEEIARRLRAERALEESNENWRRLVEYQPTGNVVHRNGVILYANRAALQAVGLSESDTAVGRDLLTFVHEDSRAVVAERLRDLSAGADPGAATVTLVRADGERADVELTSLRVTYLGQPAIQTVFWDVTERRRAEEQLRRAQKLDSVGRLAAGVAHDFNNMLQGILGHAQLLTEKLHASDARMEHLQAILEATERCSDLSRRLLAFSRCQMLDLRIIDLGDVVGRMETLLRGMLHEDVRLQIVVPAEPCRVRADVGQIEQVLINLAVNARDAMPGGGTLRIEVVAPSVSRVRPAAVDAPPGPCVELRVTDTGCGMDAFTLEHALEPFFTSKEPGRGTGLGLAMVHGIVKQHGGSIQLESEVGAGTVFTICLPASEERVEPRTVSPVVPSPAGSETVLIVEDNAAVLAVTVRLLRRHGYSVLAAASGREGLALLESHHGTVHLILTDVVMPDMNGKELAARVRASFPAVKVLFMSGHDMAVVADHGVIDAGVALIVKPFSSLELATRIRRLLDEG